LNIENVQNINLDASLTGTSVLDSCPLLNIKGGKYEEEKNSSNIFP
jgi:hypothetical protein